MMPWLSAALWEAAFTRNMKEWNEGMGTFEGGPALKRAAQDALRLSQCVYPVYVAQVKFGTKSMRPTGCEKPVDTYFSNNLQSVT